MADEPKEAAEKQLRAGATTFFFDIHKTKDKQVSYLRITASRFQGEDKPKEQMYKKQSIVVFPEQASQFSKMVADMTQKLKTTSDDAAKT